MKYKISKILVVLLVLSAIFLIYAPAAPMASAAVEQECQEALRQNSPGEGQSIPGAFPVKKCLKTEGQTNNLIPESPSGGGSNGGGGVVPPPAGSEPQPTGLKGAVVKAIDLFVKIIAGVALIVFIVGALITVSSGGNDTRLTWGKTAMMYAIIGLLVTFFSFAIVTLVQSILFY